MEEELENEGKVFEPHSNFYKIFVVQTVLVLLLVAGVMAVKYIAPDCFDDIKAFYSKNFSRETSVDEVLSEYISSEEQESEDKTV